MNLFPQALADATTATASTAQPDFMPILMMVGFLVLFYFMLWRPQSKRAKELKQLLGSLSKGDEVITSGGLLGRISKVTDDYITLKIADNVEIKLQKSAISASLPKGTLKSIEQQE